jgi:hypothetical protein
MGSEEFMAKRKRRVSGTLMKDHDGCAYMVQEQGTWQMDVRAIRQRIDDYLKEAAESGKYSISGLCIALGIPRGLLALWREGYVSETDARDGAVEPSEEISRSIEMAMLHVQRYWEERDKPSSMDVKQLEATGALSECAPPCASPPFDMGRLKKYAQ